MNKIATVSFAVLMLGGSAALAQPNGRGPYGQPNEPNGYGQYGRPNEPNGYGQYGQPKEPNGRGPYGQPDEPNGYGQYGQPNDSYTQSGQHIVCGRNLAKTVNYIIDPATGRPITQAEYQARYPWTNSSTWIYDCATNLWTDHTAQQNVGEQPYYPQAQNPERDRGRDRR